MKRRLKKNKFIDFKYQSNKKFKDLSKVGGFCPDSNVKTIDEWLDNKNQKTILFFKNLGVNDELITKLKNIKEKINKCIIYGIKNKNEEYSIEIYLHSKNDDGTNIDKNNYDKFKKDLEIILNEFDQKYNDNIEKILNENDVKLLSLEFDINNSLFNNKINLFIKEKDKNNNYIYDLQKNDLILDYNFTGVKDYSKLPDKLDKEFIDELKEISEKPSGILIYTKHLNNNIVICLLNNSLETLEKLIKKYNYKNIILDKEDTDEIRFDIFINYNLDKKKIESTGFFDYF